MAATLALVFRTRLRLLPLVLALAAAALTFGALSLAGGDLTMASIAALPVLIGLAVDYAIQFQARFDEVELAARASRARPAAARAAAARRARRSLTAGLATAVGFLVLLLSPVPMVRGFGALLVLGIVARAGLRAVRRLRRARALRAAAPAAGGRRGAGARGGWGRPTRSRHPRVHAGAASGSRTAAWRALGFALSRPRRVLAIGLAVAVLGLGARHAERGRLGRARARPAGPPGAEGRERAAGRDGRLRRDRRDRPRRRHHRPEGARLDDAASRTRSCGPTATSRAKRCAQERRPARALPGAVAPRPVQHRGAAARARCAACSTPCPPTSRRPSITARPQDREPGLRHPADAARPPEGGGRRHQGAARPARRASRPSVVGLPVLAAEANGALVARRGGAPDAARRRSLACSSCCSRCAARRARRPCR